MAASRSFVAPCRMPKHTGRVLAVLSLLFACPFWRLAGAEGIQQGAGGAAADGDVRG